MILHTVELSTQINDDGVYVNRRQGDAVEVDGKPYVSLHEGFILRAAKGWHTSRSVALLEAAGRLTAWAERLLDQADKLRREAGE
jgi:hypothetical protein